MKHLSICNSACILQIVKRWSIEITIDIKSERAVEGKFSHYALRRSHFPFSEGIQGTNLAPLDIMAVIFQQKSITSVPDKETICIFASL